MAKKQSAKTPKATTQEGRQAQMISLAEDLAEQKLRDGTASSATINFYLKLGAEREKNDIEKAFMKERIEKLKTENEYLKTAARTEERLDEAIRAFGIYKGESNDKNVF